MLPREKREDEAVKRFLEHYNQVNETSYQIIRWLDRTPQIREEQQGPIPDCLCKDQVSGAEMIIERTMLADEKVLRLEEGANKFLTEVRRRLECKLPGVFLLYEWGVDEIRYRSNTREEKITQLCQEILRVAPTLAEGEVAQLEQPFPVKLRKEKAWQVTTNCDLVYTSLSNNAFPVGRHQLEEILDEANKKFINYIHISTVLLINIWATGLDYETFKKELFQSVDMREYPNIEQIYLSEGLPAPIIYHLWSRFECTSQQSSLKLF